MRRTILVWFLRIAGGFLILPLLIIFSCDSKDPYSYAIHDPISPSVNDRPTYQLVMTDMPSINNVKLFEQVIFLNVVNFAATSQINQNPQPEVFLKTWSNPDNGTLSFTRSNGIPEKCMIKYRFEIALKDNSVVKWEVTFAGRDYPLSQQPIPVYIVGAPANTYDIVFIPDTDLGSNLDEFRTNCSQNIYAAFFSEPTTKYFRKSFNFYINRQTGHATDYNQIGSMGYHQPPSNIGNLAFAEGKVILHKNPLTDYYTSTNGIYSSDLPNRGTILHESGHGLFDLGDEYAGGNHTCNGKYANVWTGRLNAEKAARDIYHLPSASVTLIESIYYKICPADCQMNTSDRDHGTFGPPCVKEIVYCLTDISSGH